MSKQLDLIFVLDIAQCHPELAVVTREATSLHNIAALAANWAVVSSAVVDSSSRRLLIPVDMNWRVSGNLSFVRLI